MYSMPYSDVFFNKLALLILPVLILSNIDVIEISFHSRLPKLTLYPPASVFSHHQYQVSQDVVLRISDTVYALQTLILSCNLP